MTHERLTIPPNTKLLSIERLFSNAWAIWIHTNDNELRKSHWERNGTFLLLNSNGSVERVTISGGQMVDIIEVLPRGDTDASEEQG